MTNNKSSRLMKVLSRNDTGETHSHQSGISIPKKVAAAGVFPFLGTDILNPRCDVRFYDEQGNPWDFQYIYYNDLYFGKERKKAHDEFRLTCVKDFLKANNAKAGGMIWFSKNEEGKRLVGYLPKEDDAKPAQASKFVIKISANSTWRFVDI